MVAFDFPNSPVNGQVYGRYTWDGEKWTGTADPLTPPSGLPEAPNDGVTYGRRNSLWNPALPLTGGTLTGALSAPSLSTTGNIFAGGTISSTMKGNLLGRYGGTSATGAVVPADANILFNNPSGGNWAGVGTDLGGALWFRAGLAAGLVPAFYIDTTQICHFAVPPVAVTPALADNSTKLATTEFVQSKVNALVSFPEAPNDGKSYGRKSLGWSAVLPQLNPGMSGTLSENNQSLLNRQSNSGFRYTTLYNGDGSSAALSLGDSGDRVNYYTNDGHRFQNLNSNITVLSMAVGASLAASSITFNLSPTAPTPALGDSSLQLATTAFVQRAVSSIPASIPEAPNDTYAYGRRSTNAGGPVGWTKVLQQLNPDMSGVLFQNGVAMLSQGSGYTFFYNGDGGAVSLYLGGTVDRANYHRNSAHHFQNLDGTITPMSIGAGVSLAASSVSFNLSPIAPTPALGDNSTKLATTEFVQRVAIPPGTVAGYLLQTGGPGTAATWAGFVQSGGTVTRTWQNKARDIVSIIDFADPGHEVPDGSITASGTGWDWSNAFIRAWNSGSGNRVVIPPGKYRIATNGLDFTGSVVFDFMPGAVLCPDAGVTLRIHNQIVAPCQRIFGNNGQVYGINEVYPEWFGAGLGAADDAPAIKRAIACAESYSSGLGQPPLTMHFSHTTYNIGSTLYFRVGPSAGWRLKGAGTFSSTISANASFSGGALLQFNPLDQGGWCAGEFQIENLMVSNRTAGNGPWYGIFTGSDAVHNNSSIQQWIRLANVTVRGFQCCIGIWNTSGVSLDNVVTDCNDGSGGVTSGAIGFYISAGNYGISTEIQFRDCQSLKDPAGYCLVISDDGRPGLQLAGIGVSGFDFYSKDYGSNSYIKISATGGGTSVGDIWITGSRNQVEGSKGTNTIGADIRAASGGTINDVHICDLYFVGFGFRVGIKVSCDNGDINGLFISNNWINNVMEEAIQINGGSGNSIHGFGICNNFLRGCQSMGYYQAAIAVQYAKNFTIHGNFGELSANSMYSFIRVTNSDWFSMNNNISGGGVQHSYYEAGNGSFKIIEPNW